MYAVGWWEHSEPVAGIEWVGGSNFTREVKKW